MEEVNQDIRQSVTDWRELSTEIRQLRERAADLNAHDRKAKPKIMRMLKEVAKECSHQADQIDKLV